MPKFYSPRRLCQDGVLAALLMALRPSTAYAQSAPSPPPASVIPPIVLQGCSQKVKPKHAAVFANGTVLSGGATGERVIGFDVSFVNTTAKVAKMIAWRLAARPGDCMVTAVRFDDGSEWSAPPPPSPSP